MGDFLYFSGRAAQNRTEIKDFGDPYTNRCTTTLRDKCLGIVERVREKTRPFAFFLRLCYYGHMFRFLPAFFRKPRPVYHHMIAASLIIAYWWALWNILDVLFLQHSMSHIEIISIVIVAAVSIALMFLFDIDFSDVQ